MFPIEARWFLDWCHTAHVKPIFPSNPPPKTKEAPTKKTKKATSQHRVSGVIKDEFSCFKHLVLDLVPAETDVPGACSSGVGRLYNAQLLRCNEEGVFHLLSPPSVTPYVAQDGPPAMVEEAGCEREKRDGEQNVTAVPAPLQYVLVPYEIGRHLYERYDAQAHTMPATVFRR